MVGLAQALEGAGKELAESLGLDGCSPQGERPGAPEGLKGAHISMVSPETNLQLLLQGTDETNLALARAMLGMEPDEELSMEDAAECVCELANQLAGCLQRRVTAELGELRIGLPVFVDGDIKETSQTRSTTHEFSFGDIPVSLVVVAANDNAQD